jgi:hypothetical protein
MLGHQLGGCRLPAHHSAAGADKGPVRRAPLDWLEASRRSVIDMRKQE